MSSYQVTPPTTWSNTPISRGEESATAPSSPGLTDAQLRASPVVTSLEGVSTNVTLTEVRDRLPAVPLIQALTDTQLRAAPVPVTQIDLVASGTISTQNLSAAGVATANSSVELTLDGGACALSVQAVGTYTGALSLQGTINGTTWVTVGGTVFFNVNTGAASATITSAAQGIFQSECSGYAKVRISALAAVTGSVVVSVRGSKSTSLVALDAPLPAGAAVVGAVTQSGTWTAMIGNTPNSTPILANPGPPALNNLNSTASTNAISVKASAGTLYSISASNTSASIRYLKLYNKSSAPSVGTDVPVLTIVLPASGVGSTVPVVFGTLGMRFNAGIALALTAGAADSDTTGVGAGEVKVCSSYL